MTALSICWIVRPGLCASSQALSMTSPGLSPAPRVLALSGTVGGVCGPLPAVVLHGSPGPPH